LLGGFVLLAASAFAADWPMWRYDANRSAVSPQELPAKLHLQWVREYPPLKPAWPDEPRMEFDVAYEPVVAGNTMYFGSPRSDSLTAIDTDTGAEKWRFYADGPVRFAPVAWNGKVYFVSDDGCLYCLDGETGVEVWKFRGAPSDRKVLGNERLISLRPARGAPVIVDGTIYFAAGIWPFEGIFIHALDAETGSIVWTNEGSGSLFMLQPHNSPAFAGVAPQGHIVAAGDRLLIPGGRSVPACFDRTDGTFQYYRLEENGHRGGYDAFAVQDYFFNGGSMFEVATGKNLGMVTSNLVVTDETIYALRSGTVRALDIGNATFTETEDRRGRIQRRMEVPELWRLDADAETHIIAGSRLYAAGPNAVVAVDLPRQGAQPTVSWKTKVQGTPRRLLSADDKLFVVTLEGRIHCFGSKPILPTSHRAEVQESGTPSSAGTEKARNILERTGIKEGYCLVWGIGPDGLLEELARRSELHITAVDPDAEKVESARRRLDAAGLYGARIALLTGDLLSFPFPPYLASLIVCEDLETLGLEPNGGFAEKVFYPLRPYGGVACLGMDTRNHEALARAVEETGLANAELKREGDLTLLARVGPLPGSANWTHQYADVSNTGVSKDDLVRAPLGLLWFGGSSNKDILPRHGHGPSEQILDGRLFIEGPDVIRALDVYTGRVLWATSLPEIGKSYDNTSHQPGANALGSNYVSVPDGIYVAYGKSCLRLDPATGEKMSEFELPVQPGGAEPPGWGYIGVWDDLLVAGSGPMVFDEELLGFTWNAISSKRLVVMNRHTGDVVWSRQSVHGFRHNAIAVGAGKVFCIDMVTPPMLERMKRRGLSAEATGTLSALDARTGAEVWSTRENVFGTWLGYSAEHDILLQSGRPSRDMLGDEPNDRMITYRGSDGTVLWDKSVKYSAPCLLHHDTIIAQEQAFDLLTGERRMRRHPLTGVETPWQFARNYGCNSAIASEHLITFRSAAAGFFDFENDGGTANLGGFKSGCTSNLIVANGILNSPDYTRTCTCSYQNQTSLAFVHMPEVEMWSFNAFKAGDEPVERVGINFGAPGDRRADNGTLWLDYPSVGGVSPNIPVQITPEEPDLFRYHSSRIQGDGLKWVAASGMQGIKSVTLTLAPGATDVRSYTVRLHFVEPNDVKPGQRVFDVALQWTPVLRGFDAVKEAGGPFRPVVKEFKGIQVKGDLAVTFTGSDPSGAGVPVLCGIEAVAEG